MSPIRSFDGRRPLTVVRSVVSTLVLVLAVSASCGASAAVAAGEEVHPKVGEFGPLTNPNGIAVEESTGDVYVATLGVNEQQTVSLEGGPTSGGFTLEFEGQKTAQLNVGASAPAAGEVEAALDGLSRIGAGGASVTQSGSLPETVTYTVTFQGALASRTVPQLVCDASALTGGTSPSCKVATTTPGVEGMVHKFDAEGHPVEFPALHTNALTGAATPAKAFSFPNVPGTPAAVAVDNSTSPSDPSRGDLYVMDAGHNVVDKFNPNGAYLSQVTGPFHEGPIGLALAANGDVRVGVRVKSALKHVLLGQIALFDNSTENTFITSFENVEGVLDHYSILVPLQYSFAVGPTGDSYMLFEGCGCVEKFGGGGTLVGLGRVDEGIHSGPGDVAMAVDPLTGHLYVDEQTSVAEWDTGGVDGFEPLPETVITENDLPSAAEVSRFGSAQLSGATGQRGGIAVNSASGRVYVSNPADGKVYVFATTPPAVTAGAPTNVTQTEATLQGSVDPRDVPVTPSSCRFEYEEAPTTPNEPTFTVPITVFKHSVSCAQSAAQIGSGTTPVGVSADVGGLEPGTLYHFRLVAENEHGKSSSEGMFATADSGFGIKGFSVSFLNQDGTPDTQAGSHPYQMVTTFAFNTRTARLVATADSPYRLAPVGNPKDIIVDPPPGLVGDPNATEAKCTVGELDTVSCPGSKEFGCFHSGSLSRVVLSGSRVGCLYVETPTYGTGSYDIYNMVPPKGVAAQFGVKLIEPSFPNSFIDVGLRAGGEYPLQAESVETLAAEPLIRVKTTLFGVVGHGESRKPFLTLPTHCTGPLRSSISVDSWQEPGHYVHAREAEEITRNVAGEPVLLTGCSKLKFPPTIAVAPDVSDASSSSGLKVGVHVPQTAALNPDGLAESTLRDTTVTLPAGVSINPAGGGGLEGCSEGLAGFKGFEELNPNEPGVKTFTFTPTAIEKLQPGVSFCPGQSKVGTVKVKSPLLANPLEGAVYIASQNANPFGSLIAMYMMFEDPVSGSTIKLVGEVRLCESVGQVVNGVSCQAPGQIVTTFHNTPDLPFEDLELHFFGGERAPLSTPARCGTYTTQASFTPWDGNAPVSASSSFQISSGPHGGPCPGANLPFAPSLVGGSTNVNAGAFSGLTTTIGREDGQQDMQSVQIHMPPGLSGMISNAKLCPEAQANEGTCGPESLIGETTVAAGVGSAPVSVAGGKVYLTEHYAGAPFGLSIVNPVKAGPFDLERDTANPNQNPACDCVVVRAKIEIDVHSAQITVTTDPSGPHAIPRFIDGVPVQIQKVNVLVNRPGFTFNPTNCAPTMVTGAIAGDEGATQPVSVPFQVTNCAVLKFTPKFTTATAAHASKAKGASLTFKVAYPQGAVGTQSWFQDAKFDIPRQLPARLTTIQQACLASVFDANPAACPAASLIGHAIVHTPVLPVPLVGPVYFVSHGGAKFPDAVVVLQGDGVTVELVGETFINSKTKVTSATFRNTPDVPFESIEVTVPAGPFSEFAANLPSKANDDFCGQKLKMPVAFKAQNGLEIHEQAPVGVTGCPKAKKKAKKARSTKHHSTRHASRKR